MSNDIDCNYATRLMEILSQQCTNRDVGIDINKFANTNLTD